MKMQYVPTYFDEICYTLLTSCTHPNIRTFPTIKTFVLQFLLSNVPIFTVFRVKT